MPYDTLFTPIQVGDKTVKNRIQLSALTRNRAKDTIPNDLLVEHYVQKAKGEIGFLVTEGTLITRQGTEWEHAPGIWSAEQVAGWKKVTDAVHEHGAIIYVQLWHLGRVSHPDAPQQKLAGVPVYAPSAIAAAGGKFRFLPGQPGYVTPTEIPDPTILIDQFKQAAINAKEAGFDGVELHGANGYIVAQFLDYNSNKRTDKWGGSVENRARFGLEVLKVLIEVYGKNVGVKLSPGGGYNDMGMPLEDTLETYRYFISEANKLGLAYFDLSRYNEAFDFTKRGIPHDVLESYRPYITNPDTRVFLNGSVTPEEAVKFIEEKKIDGVTWGILTIAHPDLGKRLKYGKPLDGQVNWPLSQIGVGEDLSQWNVGYTDYPEASYD